MMHMVRAGPLVGTRKIKLVIEDADAAGATGQQGVQFEALPFLVCTYWTGLWVKKVMLTGPGCPAWWPTR